MQTESLIFDAVPPPHSPGSPHSLHPVNRREQQPLGANEIALWWAAMPDAAGSLIEATHIDASNAARGSMAACSIGLQDALLSQAERLQASGLRLPARRHQFLVGRMLIRTALSHYAKVDPTAWRFSTAPGGKPTIAAPALYFNLSNTNGMVICAIAHVPFIGVDVEAVQRPPISLAMAKRFLRAAELDVVLHCAPHARGRLLLQFWTLKEAYCKARGEGLLLPLSAIGFHFDGASAACEAEFDPSLSDDPAQWSFTTLSISDWHVGALAAQTLHGRPLCVNEPIRCHWSGQ